MYLVGFGNGILPVFPGLSPVLSDDTRVQELLNLIVASGVGLPVVPPEHLRLQTSQLEGHVLIDRELVNLEREREREGGGEGREGRRGEQNSLKYAIMQIEHAYIF